MKCLCDVRCRLWKDVDMFGKEPEFYYKGRPKKTSWIGRILSFSFVLIYLAFFVYKFVKMLKKTDVTFYDTFTYAPKPPAVPITHNNFYIAFALEDPITYNPFIDEGVYNVKAFFKRAEMKGDDFEWQVVELEIERCKLDKFGESYKEVFEHMELNNFYCFKDINNFILEGHFSYYLYSFFYLEFFPCINTTESQKCKPLEEIDYYLKNTFVSLEMEDIELTPKNYKHPIRPRNVDVYTTVGKKLFQEIHAYFEVVNIETDLDWFGFDEFEKIKTETFLKYDETFIMSNLIENNIYETGEKFCDITLKLSENVRTQRRIYTKFVTILGDIGGFMEVIFTLFRIMCALSVDILYEVSMVNNLFSFELEKKNIILKFGEENNRLKSIHINNTKKGDEDAKNPPNDNDIIIMKSKKSENRLKSRSGASKGKSSKYLKDSNISSLSSAKSKTNFQEIDIYNGNPVIANSSNDMEQYNKEWKHKSKIKKVKLNRACIYFWFCFVRRRNILPNALLNEGMDLISSRLDVFNIFKKIYLAEQRKEVLANNIIPMSPDCNNRINLIMNNMMKI